MSKGDWRRPAQVPPKEVDREWERIFGCPKPEAREDRERT